MVTADAIAVLAIPAAAAPVTTPSAARATDNGESRRSRSPRPQIARFALARRNRAGGIPAAEGTDAPQPSPAPANAPQWPTAAKPRPARRLPASARPSIAQATSADLSTATGIAAGRFRGRGNNARRSPRPPRNSQNPDLATKSATTAVEQAGTTDPAAD